MYLRLFDPRICQIWSRRAKVLFVLSTRDQAITRMVATCNLTAGLRGLVFDSFCCRFIISSRYMDIIRWFGFGCLCLLMAGFVGCEIVTKLCKVTFWLHDKVKFLLLISVRIHLNTAGSLQVVVSSVCKCNMTVHTSCTCVVKMTISHLWLCTTHVSNVSSRMSLSAGNPRFIDVHC